MSASEMAVGWAAVAGTDAGREGQKTYAMPANAPTAATPAITGSARVLAGRATCKAFRGRVGASRATLMASTPALVIGRGVRFAVSMVRDCPDSISRRSLFKSARKSAAD